MMTLEKIRDVIEESRDDDRWGLAIRASILRDVNQQAGEIAKRRDPPTALWQPIEEAVDLLSRQSEEVQKEFAEMFGWIGFGLLALALAILVVLATWPVKRDDNETEEDRWINNQW